LDAHAARRLRPRQPGRVKLNKTLTFLTHLGRSSDGLQLSAASVAQFRPNCALLVSSWRTLRYFDVTKTLVAVAVVSDDGLRHGVTRRPISYARRARRATARARRAYLP